MKLVNAHRLRARICRCTLGQPVAIVPMKTAVVPNDGGRLGGDLKKESVRIRLFQQHIVRRVNLELVMAAFTATGHE